MHVPRRGGSCPLTRNSSNINSWVPVLTYPDAHPLRAHPNIPSCLFLVYFFHRCKSIWNYHFLIFIYLRLYLLTTPTHFSHISSSTSFSFPQYLWENIPSAHHFSSSCTKEAMHATNRPFSVLLLPMWSINANMCGSNQRNQNSNSCQPSLSHSTFMHHHCKHVKDGWKNGISALVSCSENGIPDRKMYTLKQDCIILIFIWVIHF